MNTIVGQGGPTPQLSPISPTTSSNPTDPIHRGGSTPSRRTAAGLQPGKFKINSDGKAELAEKSKIGHWAVKLAAGMALGAGIGLLVTGVGGLLGGALIAGGLFLYGFSQATSMAEAAETAMANNENPLKAMGWDLLKGLGELCKGVAQFGFPIAVAAALTATVAVEGADLAGSHGSDQGGNRHDMASTMADVASTTYDIGHAIYPNHDAVPGNHFQPYPNQLPAYNMGYQVIYVIVQNPMQMHTPEMPHNIAAFNPYV